MVTKVFFLFFFNYTNNWDFPVAQRLKPLPAMRKTWVRSLGWEDRLEKEMVTHSSILAWRIPWMEKPGRLQSMGSQRVGHDWATSLSLSIKLTANSLIFSVEIKVILKLMSVGEDSIFFSLNGIPSRKRWSLDPETGTRLATLWPCPPPAALWTLLLLDPCAQTLQASIPEKTSLRGKGMTNSLSQLCHHLTV